MKITTFITLLLLVSQNLFSQNIENQYFPKESQLAKQLPPQQNLWVFLQAGQSNMAGRGLVEPQDTVPDKRILAMNIYNDIVLAKEPLHFYEPTRTGLDCGLSFAKTLLPALPDSVTVLLVPLAVGGSSIQQWLGDSIFRGVKLLTNAKEKIELAQKIGTIKGILWHQGESNAGNEQEIAQHLTRLTALVDTFRRITAVQNLPFLIGELGSFSKRSDLFNGLNQQLSAFTKIDSHSALIKTADLKDKGDALHFNADGQRQMGVRFAQTYISQFLSSK
jgi:Carbohydrate esterase, sialic acid-specific acetylesterase